MDEHPQNSNPDSEAAVGIPPEARGDNITAAPTPEPTPAPIPPEFELVEVEWRGARWQIPKDRGLWDMNVQFEFEEGNRLRGLLTLLGGSPSGIGKARREVYAVARTNREVDDFMDHVTAILNKECVG